MVVSNGTTRYLGYIFDAFYLISHTSADVSVTKIVQSRSLRNAVKPVIWQRRSNCDKSLQTLHQRSWSAPY